MSIKDRLQIFLVTYNRYEHLKKTCEQLLDENSPVKDFDITVINNNSTDSTKDYLAQLASEFKNISVINNKYNVGAAANLIKPFELASKDYIWVLCDDDFYNWDSWHEVEDAINNDKDVICVSHSTFFEKNDRDNFANIILELSFTPAGIYKMSNMDDTTMRNMYETTYILFPYMCILFNYLNKGGRDIFVTKSAIVTNGMTVRKTKHDISYTRGSDLDNLNIRSKNMSWNVGYINICKLIKDEDLRYEIVVYGHKKLLKQTLFDVWKELVRMLKQDENYLSDLADVFVSLCNHKLFSSLLFSSLLFSSLLFEMLFGGFVYNLKLLRYKISYIIMPKKRDHYKHKIQKMIER